MSRFKAMFQRIPTDYSLEVKLSNLDDFSNKFQSVWVGLRNQRVEYEKRVAALAPYKGSKGYEKDMAEVEKTYSGNVKAIQNDAASEFNRILARMKEKVAPAKMDVPTDEQIRILQVLSMRERLSHNDIALASENLRSSDTAMAVLSDIAMRSGTMIPTSYKSSEQQRRAVLETLVERVNGLCHWNGSDADAVRAEWRYNRSAFNPDADPSKVNPYTFTTARIAEMGGADMQGMVYKKSCYELCRALVGDDVPWDAVTGLA